MIAQGTSQGGGHSDLRDLLVKGKSLPFKERTSCFSNWIGAARTPGRAFDIADRTPGAPRRMLVFGAGNTLGLTRHPYVRERVKRIIDVYGVDGPPLREGYTCLHRHLEERLAAFLHQEDALLFASGYDVGAGLFGSLVNERDTVLHDVCCHGALCDGIKAGRALALTFPHNDVGEFSQLLDVVTAHATGDTFVAVEGVYALDGETAPLDRLAPRCRAHEAVLVVYDAHGLGVLGPGGRGAAAHGGVEGQVDIILGAFGQAFGVGGGFVATTKAVADYLRFFARAYFRAAMMPPTAAAAVLACLDLLEQEPALRQKLHQNVAYAAQGLRRLGFETRPQAAIVSLPLPPAVRLRRALSHFHRAGIFIQAVEQPGAQGLAVGLAATHTCEDIDRLLACFEQLWAAGASEAAVAPAAFCNN